MQSRLLACASAALIVASACGSNTIPTPGPTQPSAPIVLATATATGTPKATSTPTPPPSAATPSPAPIATPAGPTLPPDACTNCDGNTIYLLKNATDFDYYDPQRIYTPEDEAFLAPRTMRSLVAYKYSANPAEATTLVPDMATDTGTTNSDATIWTFSLRDGLAWQDGSPVKCEDVKYGVSRTFATDVINGGPTYAIKVSGAFPRPKTAPRSTRAHTAAKARIYSDQAVICDGNTITFHLNQTLPDFNYATTLGFGAVPNPRDHPDVDTAGELRRGRTSGLTVPTRSRRTPRTRAAH